MVVFALHAEEEVVVVVVVVARSDGSVDVVKWVVYASWPV